MGTDVHICAGKLPGLRPEQARSRAYWNELPLILRDRAKSEQTLKAFHIDGEYERHPDGSRDLDLRDYHLFSFLSGMTPCVQPLVADLRHSIWKNTLSMIDVFNEIYPRDARLVPDGPSPFIDQYLRDSEFGYFVLPVLPLLEFDYGQMVQYLPVEKRMKDYIVRPGTYRQQFTPSWFKVLERLAADQKDFIILGFDC